MGEKSTKELIIEILAEHWPLTARAILFKVRKYSGKSLTYQAVHKTITKMMEEGIVVKDDKKYLLDSSWVMSSKQFFNFVEKSYKDKSSEKIPYSKAHLHNYVKYSFDTVAELGEFIGNYLSYFPNPKDKSTIFRWFAMYSLIGLSKEVNKKVRAIVKKHDHYIICRTNSLYDQFIAKAYSLFGKKVKIKLGIDCSDECDYMIVGDYVCRIYFSPAMKDKVKKLQKNTLSVKSFNLQELFGIMHNKFDIPHYIIIEKDAIIAKQLRESTIKYFKSTD